MSRLFLACAFTETESSKMAGTVHSLPHELSMKLLRMFDRIGCFSFLSAFASIWRMRFMPMPKCMRVIDLQATYAGPDAKAMPAS